VSGETPAARPAPRQQPAEVHLRFRGVSAKDVAAIVSRAGHEDR
jgi:hypothetical protein